MSAGRNTGVPVAAPLHVSVEQADQLFHAIAITAMVARGIAADACESAGDGRSADALFGLQRQFELIGALADSATGGDTCGTLADWVYGQHFPEARR